MNSAFEMALSARLRVFCCACVLMLAGLGSTPASDFSSTLWQMSEGLPHNIVQAITQTRDGYIWVGTREGLASFDGVKFHVIDLGSDIVQPSILCVLEARDGSLWIGTENVGLFHLRDGKISRCSLAETNRDFTVYQIFEDGAGSIWVASSAGVLQGADEKFQRKMEFKNGLQSLCVDRAGAVWFGGDGLKRIDTAGSTNVVPRSGQLPKEARTMYCDRDGNLWIGSGAGLTQWKDGAATFYRKGDGPSGFVSAILQDHAGELWIGSYAGLGRFENGKFIDENDPDEPSYRVYAIFEDHEGTLWVGSEEGLARLTPKRFKTITKKQGLTLNTVVTVCPSRDGSIWISAWGGGLNHLVDGIITVFNKTDGLSSDFVMAMHEGRDGSLWVGTDYGSTLNRIRDGKITYYGRAEGFVASATTVLLEDNQGTLWAGTREGLYMFRDGKFTRFTTKDGLSHNKINALFESRDGGMWVGTEAGLTHWLAGKFEDASGNNPRLNAMIFSLYEDKDGVLWIGTKDRGLLRWQNGKLQSYSSSQGLFSESIYSILEDNRNNLWLNSSKGIFRLDKKQLDAVVAGKQATVTSITYGKSDGIISSGQYRDVTQPAACKGIDGRLWFRTTQGAAVVDPAEIGSNELAPPVVIQQVIADKKIINIFPGMTNNFRTNLADATGEIIIPPGRGELEIQYAALSFRAPEKNQFRYKLDGVDLAWVEAGQRHAAYYNNLQPGKYRFHVAACNNDGVWNDTGTSLAFILKPHFSQTWWFFSLVVIACVGFVGGTVRYTTRKKMQQKLALLEQQNALEKERARIARDIHDDIGAGLTEIALTSEFVEDPSVPAEETRQLAREISGRARELVTGMDEIVWAINPRNDTVRSAAAYFSQFAQRMLKPASTSCRLDIDPDLPELPLSSEQRHDLFLSFKEALNNVTKHAKATEVKVSVRMENRVLTVSVQDNGLGFVPGDLPLSGDGLINMRERLLKLGGNCEITSAVNQGTKVAFRLPLNRGGTHP